MIRYSFPPDPARDFRQQLEAAVAADSSTWLQRAKTRTDHDALAILESNLPQARRDIAKADIERLRKPSSRHSSCVNAACDRYVRDPLEMRDLFQAARIYLDSLE